MKDILDLHTHTIASGHAYNTMNEMIAAAKSRGLEIYGITEHAPRMNGSCTEMYFQNFRILSREKDGMTVLITGDSDEMSNNRIYQVSGVSSINTVILQPVINGLSTDGSPVEGEGITVRKGRYAGVYYYYNNGEWVTGQQKVSVNQSPLFQLYDDEKNALDNQLYYNQSSFKGSKLFDYVTTDDSGATIDEDLNKAIVTDGYGNIKRL